MFISLKLTYLLVLFDRFLKLFYCTGLNVLHTSFCFNFFTLGALAGVSVGAVCALGAISARRAGTLVDVYLAEVSSEA